MIHECPRCGYNTEIKANFKKHITNKMVIGKTIHLDIWIMIKGKRTFILNQESH